MVIPGIEIEEVQDRAPARPVNKVSKRAAGSFYTASLFSERTRKIVRFLSRFG